MSRLNSEHEVDSREEEVDVTKVPRQEAINMLKGNRKYESVIDLENLPKVTHIWVDRGLRKVCESPSCKRHEAWVRH